MSGGLWDSFIHRESLRLSVFRPRHLTCLYYHYASCFSEYILKLRYAFDFLDLHEPNDNKALSPVRRQYHLDDPAGKVYFMARSQRNKEGEAFSSGGQCGGSAKQCGGLFRKTSLKIVIEHNRSQHGSRSRNKQTVSPEVYKFRQRVCRC